MSFPSLEHLIPAVSPIESLNQKGYMRSSRDLTPYIGKFGCTALFGNFVHGSIFPNLAFFFLDMGVRATKLNINLCFATYHPNVLKTLSIA